MSQKLTSRPYWPDLLARVDQLVAEGATVEIIFKSKQNSVCGVNPFEQLFVEATCLRCPHPTEHARKQGPEGIGRLTGLMYQTHQAIRRRAQNCREFQ